VDDENNMTEFWKVNNLDAFDNGCQVILNALNYTTIFEITLQVC